MKLRSTTALSVFATTLAASFATTDPKPGSHGRSPIEFHEKLIEALDSGDVATARSLFAADPLLYVVDARAQPVKLYGPHAVDSFVSLWALNVEDADPTRVVSCTVVSDDSSKSVVTFELERPGSEVRRLRGTSVLSKEHGPDGVSLEVLHLHISPAERRDY